MDIGRYSPNAVMLMKEPGTMQHSEFVPNDPVLVEIVQRLVEAFHPERLYLFGSKARGQTTPDSDYDLFMVLERLEAPRYRLEQQAHSLLWELGTAADIVVWPREDFEGRLHLAASLPATVVREGILLYAA